MAAQFICFLKNVEVARNSPCQKNFVYCIMIILILFAVIFKISDDNVFLRFQMPNVEWKIGNEIVSEK